MISTMVIVGRIAFDPRGNENCTAATIHVNVSRNFKKEGEAYPETDKVVCKAFGERAKMILDKFQKGDYVVVHGRLQLSKDYVNSKNETVKGDWELMIEHIDGPYVKRGGDYNEYSNAAPASNPTVPPRPNIPPTPNTTSLPKPNAGVPAQQGAPARTMPPIPPIPTRQ